MKKTKILILGLTSLVGGVETYITNLVRNIDREKFEIDFLVQDDIVGINKEKISGYYNNIFKVPNFKRHPIKAMKILKKIYIKQNYDAVHLNLSTASSVLYALPSKIYIPETKIIVHSHNGGDKNSLQHYIFRNLLNLIVDERLACSKLAADWMFGKKYIAKTEILNNAIETQKFTFDINIRNKIREELKVIDNDFVIGHVGRFNAQKNHIGMIEIFKNLVIKDNNMKLILLGTGELEERIKELVKKYDIENNVMFLGVRSNVNEFYQAMDLFILPSIFEGLPIVGIEAQASDLRCIFSDNVTKEVDITGNVDFISIEDKEKWTDRIIELKNKSYSRKNIRKLIKDKGYDLEEEIKKIERIYMEKEHENKNQIFN